MQATLFDISNPADVVYTPGWAAKDMIEWFKPSGKILEPCRGKGAFYNLLPPGSEWCEISQGRDFFAWTKPVDWIISNPPFPELRDWVEHGFLVAGDIVYLVPLKNFFSAYGFMDMVHKYGWLKHIRLYGTGTKLDFPMGNAIGALHFQRDYWGDTSWSWYGRKFNQARKQ